MLQKKQLLFLAIGTGMILFVVIVSALSSHTSGQVAETTTPTPADIVTDSGIHQGTSGGPSSQEITQPLPSNKWQIYKNSNFSFSYPSDWSVEDNSSGSVGAIVVTPKTDYYDPSAPSFSIITYSSSSESLADRVANVAGIGYKTTNVIMSGVSATKLSIQLPSVQFNGKQYGSKRMQTKTYLQKGAVQYGVITMSQVGSSDEVTIKDMYNSFKLN